MPLVLVTAFGPFGDVQANPSEGAVHALAARGLGDVRLVTEVLPVEFARCVPRMSSLVRELRPDVVIATLPVKAMAAAVRRAGIPCSLSLSAGTYACNAVMYAALHHAPAGTRAGFAHLPPVDRLALDDAVTALEVVLRTALTTHADLATPEGAFS